MTLLITHVLLTFCSEAPEEAATQPRSTVKSLTGKHFSWHSVPPYYRKLRLCSQNCILSSFDSTKEMRGRHKAETCLGLRSENKCAANTPGALSFWLSTGEGLHKEEEVGAAGRNGGLSSRACERNLWRNCGEAKGYDH